MEVTDIQYKESEIGVIPVGWEVKPIGTEIDLLTGYPFPSDKYIDSGVRLLRGSNVKRGTTDWSHEITQYWERLTPDLMQYVLKEGDIVIAMDGSLVGKSFARLTKEDIPALLLQRVARIRSTKIDLGYLKEFVCSDYFTKHCESVKTVSAIPHISPKDIRSFTIPIPPTKSEQIAIATALSDTDALIENLEKLIAKKRNIKQGVMQELLTGSIRLDGFEKKWLNVSLGEISEITMGQSPQSKYYNTKGLGLPLVQGNADIEDRKTIIRIHTTEITKIGEPGTTIMSVRAPVGEIAKTNFRCCLGRGVCAIKYKNDFLYHLLIYLEDSWGKYSTGSTFDSINSSQVTNLEIYIPSDFSEQVAIASIFNDIDEEIETLEEKLYKYKMIKQGMMQSLLTGKIRLV